MPGGPLFIHLPYIASTSPSPLPTNWSNLTPADFNCTYGIRWIYQFMGQCVMDARGMAAMVCGFVCLFSWILNGIPQMIENFRSGIPDKAMSPFLLLFWALGDLLNFVGCILAHQLILQIVVSVYSIASDFVLISQFIYYKTRRQGMMLAVSNALGDGRVSADSSTSDLASDSDLQPLNPSSERTNSRSLCVCFAGFVGLTVYAMQFTMEPNSFGHHSQTFGGQRVGPTARRLLQLVLPVDLANPGVALSDRSAFLPDTKAKVGYVLGWISTVMYLSSRFPQIFRNFQRGSTEGLCVGLFCLAVMGNASYGLQIFLTSLYPTYLLEALPWLIGSVGVLALDFLATLDQHAARENWRAKDRLRSSLLALFPAALIGQVVKVTLLDNSQISGRLESCDGMLNLVLSGGVLVTPANSMRDRIDPIELEEITIFGKRVRYVSLPETLDVHKTLREWDFDLAPGPSALPLNKRMLSRPKRSKDKYAYLRQNAESCADSSCNPDPSADKSSHNPEELSGNVAKRAPIPDEILHLPSTTYENLGMTRTGDANVDAALLSTLYTMFDPDDLT